MLRFIGSQRDTTERLNWTEYFKNLICKWMVVVIQSEFAQIHACLVSDAIQPSHPVTPLLPSIFSSIRVFSNELACCLRWPSIGALASDLPVNIQG